MSHAGSWLTWVNRVDHLPVKTLPTFANYGHLFNEFPICNVVELSKKWIGLSNQCSESIFKIRFLMSGLVLVFRGFLLCVRSVNIESWVSTMSTIIPLMHFLLVLPRHRTINFLESIEEEALMKNGVWNFFVQATLLIHPLEEIEYTTTEFVHYFCDTGSLTLILSLNSK